MNKLKMRYNKYVARNHCRCVLHDTYAPIRLECIVPRIWQLCPMYDEAQVHKFAAASVCCAIGKTITTAAMLDC